MNARQKAKKYKRLYEKSRIQPYIIEEYRTLQHYAYSQMIGSDMVMELPEEAIMKVVTKRMAEALRPLIEKNAEITRDERINRYIYRIDLWMRN